MTAVFEQVDSLYEDVVRKSAVCQECSRSRPRLGGGGWYARRKRVIMFQVTPGGQFHMRLPDQTHSICGRDA